MVEPGPAIRISTQSETSSVSFVEEYYPALKAQLVAQDTELPAYVQREFEAYLKCGRLEGGFSRVRPDGSLRFRWVKAPNGAELMQLAYTHRVGRFLERHGLLESDAENSYLAGEAWKRGRWISC